MQIPRVAVEEISVFAKLFKRLSRLFPQRHSLAREAERCSELRENVLLVRFVAMENKAEISQANAFEASVYDVQRCHFFTNKENFLAVGKRLGDDVGDGLALSRSRRALEHETDASLGAFNSIHLA